MLALQLLKWTRDGFDEHIGGEATLGRGWSHATGCSIEVTGPEVGEGGCWSERGWRHFCEVVCIFTRLCGLTLVCLLSFRAPWTFPRTKHASSGSTTTRRSGTWSVTRWNIYLDLRYLCRCVLKWNTICLRPVYIERLNQSLVHNPHKCLCVLSQAVSQAIFGFIKTIGLHQITASCET